jgi:LmbE family N-acetylglucosaminyl deacetylase
MSTILGIWAHPDDEVFTSGGYMAEAVARGDRVVCLHLTRGEAGLYHREKYPTDVLAAVREKELKTSLSILGVAEQHFMDYPDGGLRFARGDEVVARLHDVLVGVNPDVILTFGSDGFTGHPDHKSLSTWVTAATRLWSKPGVRILHAAVPTEWKSTVVARLNEFDFFWPGHPQTRGRSDLSLRLDGETLGVKVEALRAHESQMQPLFDAYGEAFMRAVAATEVFRAGPRSAFRSQVLLDLKRGA